MIIKTFTLISFLLFISCSYNTNNECLDAINHKILKNEGKEISLDFAKELNCFEWNEILFLENHFEPEEIKKSTGINLNGYKLLDLNYIAKSDFYSHILLLKDKKIVGVINTSGKLSIDEIISEMNDNMLINKSDTKFLTYETDIEYLDGKKVFAIKFRDDKLLNKYKRNNN